MKKHLHIKMHLTKDFLKSLGVINVTEDGRVFTSKGELNYYTNTTHHKYGKDRVYKVIQLYDHDYYLYQKDTGRTPIGNRCIPLHRVVYAWFNGYIPQGYDIDHIDNDTFNNNINNLQPLTRKENLAKRGRADNQYTAHLSDEEYHIIKTQKSYLRTLIESKKQAQEELNKLKEELHYLKKDYKLPKNSSYWLSVSKCMDKIERKKNELDIIKLNVKELKDSLKK